MCSYSLNASCLNFIIYSWYLNVGECSFLMVESSYSWTCVPISNILERPPFTPLTDYFFLVFPPFVLWESTSTK